MTSAGGDWCDLTDANLRGTDLTGANLNGADLRGAYLYGAVLWNVENLTQQQIDAAFGDKETKLPEGIIMPKTWK